MSCKYVRRMGEVWEYGDMVISKRAPGTRDIYTHSKRGTAPGYEDACQANLMATEGAPRIGTRHDEMPWREFG